MVVMSFVIAAECDFDVCCCFRCEFSILFFTYRPTPVYMLSDLICFFRNLSDVFWEAVRKRQFMSLYQGLQTKNVHSFISSFIYFYGYNYYKRLYVEKSGAKSIGTMANLLVAAAAGASTVIVTQVCLFNITAIL
jgi:hypothetical protein